LGIDSPTGHRLKSKRSIKKISKRKSKPILIKTKKRIQKKPIRKIPLKKAKIGYSKKRRGQLMMKPRDIYEKQMIQRIQHKSGMTYIQATHLVRKSRETDTDIEHKIDWTLSKDKSEQYEQATKQLTREINPLKRSIKDLSAEASMYGF